MLYKGANFVGGDTSWKQWADVSKGPVSGVDYLFLTKSEVDDAVSHGANIFRVVFAWEAIMPDPASVLTGLSGNFATYFAKFDSLVSYITNVKGCHVLLDIHPGDSTLFACYYGQKIGTTYQGHQVQALFAGFWKQLAQHYKGNYRVSFGLMNEPWDMPTDTWFAAAQDAIYAIRSVGSNNRIWCPGNYFSGAGSWASTSMFDTGSIKVSNAQSWHLADPARNLGVQVHLYFDVDAGGGTTQIVSPTIGVERLQVVTDWARAMGLKIFVAEIALAANQPTAAETWKNTYNYMIDNPNVIDGFCWWAYGPPAWWSSYQFALNPAVDAGADSGQMALVRPSFTRIDPR